MQMERQISEASCRKRWYITSQYFSSLPCEILATFSSILISSPPLLSLQTVYQWPIHFWNRDDFRKNINLPNFIFFFSLEISLPRWSRREDALKIVFLFFLGSTIRLTIVTKIYWYARCMKDWWIRFCKSLNNLPRVIFFFISNPRSLEVLFFLWLDRSVET